MSQNTARGKRGAKNRRNNSLMVRGRDASQLVIPHPPMISAYNFSHGTRMRFTVQGSLFNAGITYADLLDTWVFAATATTVYDIFESVKVRAVEVWAAPVQGGAPATCTVIFNGAVTGTVGDQQTHTDTSMGVEPAHVLARPNAKSQASQYQLFSSDEAFYLVAPVGAVIDVELSFKQAFFFSQLAQNAAVGATAGVVYNRGLDGLAASVTRLPTALASINAI